MGDVDKNITYFDTDLYPQKPASVPPLPLSVRQPRAHNTTVPSSTATNRTYATPALPSHRRTCTTNCSRGHSNIVDLMPLTTRRGPSAVAAASGRGGASRLLPPSTVRPSPSVASRTQLQTPPPPPPPAYSPASEEEDEEDNSSDASLTPTEDGDEFIEDGLGGSSFMTTNPPGRHSQPLSTEGLGNLDRCLTEVLGRPRNNDSHHQRPVLEKSLEGYVFVEAG